MKTSKNNKALRQSKSRELLPVLVNAFDPVMNLARIKFLHQFLCSLCKVQTVNFEKLAMGFETLASLASSLRRIQRFMAEYRLDIDLIARLIFSILPHKPPYTLILDRTNWKLGKKNINILTLAIAYDGVAFPILFSVFNKRGNSSSEERISLIERYIALFGEKSIDCLVADREFVGKEWIGFLNSNSIRYHIRCRNNWKVFDYKSNKKVYVDDLFHGLPLGKIRAYDRVFRIKNEDCYLSGSRIKTEKGIEFQILISFNKPQEAHSEYKERWQIECAFKSLKSSGFDIEKTHLTAIDRFEKLFSLVILAFTWAYLVGIHVHKYVLKIRLLKHGYKAKTFFKHGLEAIASALLNPLNQSFKLYAKFLSCT